MKLGDWKAVLCLQVSSLFATIYMQGAFNFPLALLEELI